MEHNIAPSNSKDPMETFAFTKVFLAAVLTCSFLFYAAGDTWCQANNSPVADKIDPSQLSPTAASFSNYISYPEVSNSGTIDINAPIYRLEERDLSLDIGLRYDMRGIKVNSAGTWVGTGWTLEAGGAIVREVKDLPDDASHNIDHIPQKGAVLGTSYYGWLNWFYGEGSYLENFPNIEGSFGSPTDPRKPAYAIQYLRMQYANGAHDLEPDIYTVNINGSSFKFIFNQHGEPKILGLNDYKIDYVKSNGPVETYTYHTGGGSTTYDITERNEHIIEFIITDSNGYKYYFNEVEYTQPTHKKFSLSYNYPNLQAIGQFDEPLPKHPSAWYLTKIRSPHNNEINLTYYSRNITEKPPLPKFLGHCLETDCSEDINRTKFQLLDDVMNDPVYDRRTVYSITAKYLDKITTDNFEVQFKSQKNRLDLPGNPELNTIQVYYRPGNELIKEYEFDYSYSNAASCPLNIPSEWCKRLFLNKVSEIGEKNDTIDRHKFEYNSKNLPYRYSAQQDFWGYFNGNGAKSLIPKLYVYPNAISANDRFRTVPTNFGSPIVLNGADRNVDTIAIRAGILEKIIFPTGGERIYTFEPNTFYDNLTANPNQLGPGLRVRSVTHKPGEDLSKNIIRSYHYNNSSGITTGIIYARPIFGNETNFYRRPGVTIYDNVFDAIVRGLHDSGFSSNETWDRFTKRSTHPYNPVSDILGNTIGYTKITESILNHGQMVHEFHVPNEYVLSAPYVDKNNFGQNAGSNYDNVVHFPSWGSITECLLEDNSQLWGDVKIKGYNIYPFPPAEINYLAGKKSSTTVFAENGDRLERIELSYRLKEINAETVNGVVYNLYDVICDAYSQGKYQFMWSKYNMPTNQDVLLEDVITIRYDKSSLSEFQTEEHYNYTDSYPLPSSKITRYPDGKRSKENFTYVFDLCKGVEPTTPVDEAIEGFWMWKNNHRISRPVETILSEDGGDGTFYVTRGTLMMPRKGSLFEGSNQNQVAYIWKVLQLELPSPQPGMTSTSISGENLIYDDRYVLEKELLDYDNRGNPLMVIGKNGLKTRYAWGHNQSLLMLVEEGAFSSRSQVTSFTHLPGVGVSSMTDPNGLTKYFVYDQFDRLNQSKDHDQNIVNQFNYFYSR